MRPDSPSVDELGRVLLEVDAVDAHVAQPPAAAQRARRTGRSGSPSGGRDRSSSCGGRSTAARSRSRARAPSAARSGSARALATGSVPGSPRQTGQVRVLGGSPKDSAQRAEHLRPGRELDVDLQPDDGLVVGHAARRVPSKPIACSSAWAASRMRFSLNAGPAIWKPAGSPSESPLGIEMAGMPGQRHRDGAEVVEVHGQRVVGLRAELEGDGRAGRRDHEVEVLEGGGEVLGDLRAHPLGACRSRRRSSPRTARRCRA